jgi:hypothetical protein
MTKEAGRRNVKWWEGEERERRKKKERKGKICIQCRRGKITCEVVVHARLIIDDGNIACGMFTK